MKNTSFTEEVEQELRTTLKRCKPQVIDAAIAFKRDGEKSRAMEIILGIIERFLEPESRPKMQDANLGSFRLIEDLGVDSLVMVEIVMTIEEVLELSIPNDDLRELSTVDDIKNYIERRIDSLEGERA